MIRIVLAITFLLPLFLFAQEIPARRNQIKLSPLRLIDWGAPGIELGYERLHATQFAGFDYISSQLSVAYLDNLLHANGSRIPKGYRVSFEEKFFAPTILSNGKQRLFFALETVYLMGRYKDHMSVDDTINHVVLTDTLSVLKQTMSFSLKAGIQCYFGRFIVEFAAGLGLRTREIIYSEKDYPDLPFSEWPSNGPWGYDPSRFMEGKSSTLVVPANIKIGFTF